MRAINTICRAGGLKQAVAQGVLTSGVMHECIRGGVDYVLAGSIRDDGPLTIRDIDDDVLVEKDHLWASRKPSKRALQLAFYNGEVVISARAGMLKTYELTARHFGWATPLRPASERQVTDYRLDRALRRLLGLDVKLRQYRDGERFVRTVVEEVGMDGFNRVWTSPNTLPTRTEITSPAEWVARVHG